MHLRTAFWGVYTPVSWPVLWCAGLDVRYRQNKQPANVSQFLASAIIFLLTVYDALKEKGYNPISQIVGYILSEDPTYITTHNNARSLIRRIDRDELLKAMVRSYLGE